MQHQFLVNLAPIHYEYYGPSFEHQQIYRNVIYQNGIGRHRAPRCNIPHNSICLDITVIARNILHCIVWYSTVHCTGYSCSGGVILPLCREVFPREHLSTERILQHMVLLWRSSHLIPDIISKSDRSLGTAPIQVRDDHSSRLTELEEDEEIKADI